MDLLVDRKGDNRYLIVITDRLLKGVTLEAMPTMNVVEYAYYFRDY